MGALICCAFERSRQWTDRKKRERTGMECPRYSLPMEKGGFPILRKKEDRLRRSLPKKDGGWEKNFLRFSRQRESGAGCAFLRNGLRKRRMCPVFGENMDCKKYSSTVRQTSACSRARRLGGSRGPEL